MGNNTHHRAAFNGKAASDLAQFSSPYSGPSKGNGPLHAPTVTSVTLRLSETRGFGTVATWGGRPISKWCRYGFWDETGRYLTMTRVL